MKCWTIQHINWWKNAKGSVLRATWARADKDLRVTYREFCQWLIQEGRWPKGAAPVWLWVVSSHRSRRPDLREGGHYARGTRCVLLELDVPDHLPICTNFLVWCDFMSRQPTPGWVPYSRDTLLLNRLLIPSGLVYRKRRRTDGWSHEGVQTVQAIVPYVRREWIQSVKQFVAK